MSQQPGHWTIHDIARELAVSAKTVSRVLNRQSGVGAETRRRIEELMEKVGYQPHIGARSLRGHHNACLGITLPAPVGEVPLSQEFLFWLFNYLYQIFGTRGEYVAFDLNPRGAGEAQDYARGVWQQLFKALIIAGPLRPADTVLRRLHDSGTPYVVIGRLDSLPEASCAAVDYEEGAYRSTRYLLDRGHRRIAMLKAFSGFQPGIERMRGYRRALEEAGIAFEQDLVIPVSFDAQRIIGAVHRLLADRTVTGLIDSSGTEDGASLREGARRACRDCGKDFDLVAWTYVNNAAVLPEAAAHVWLPVREAAAQGIVDLFSWMTGDRTSPVRVLYPPVLDERRFAVEVPKPRRLFDMQAG
ncbi:MAG: LacI family transcriptional regulator [Candidatus Hydrogenedentes bacterium]|nr:LacI family transcriptional regulator [Candidatus Hydrogenedentota bacterium]